MQGRPLAISTLILALVAFAGPGRGTVAGTLSGAPSGAPDVSPPDVYAVTLDPDARDTPATGRLILFFVQPGARGRWRHAEPARGPFFDPPQPIASIAVEDLAPGAVVRLDASAVSFPPSIEALAGPTRVQAVLDVDDTERTHLAGPGNLLSDVVTVDLRPRETDTVTLRLVRAVPAPRPRVDRENLKWIERRSPVLSAFYGRDVFHRAGVALPAAYLASTDTPRRWPAVYVVPGLGGRWDGARDYARMLGTPGIESLAPVAVHVVLDPETPRGHHGFVDSPNHGPRGTALVTELIPWLEEEFRLAPRPEARIVTGHSSGGWSALWLQLRWPEVFGGCWASAPDPVDFRAFQTIDLECDVSVYVDAAGREPPSFRQFTGPEGEMTAVMTVRQECRMERALDPGGSGRQWDSWAEMFSPREPAGSRPRRLFDPRTGIIDRDVARHWCRFDLSRRVAEDWARYGPIVMERVRLSCGSLDSYYLDRAVTLFKERVERLAAANGGWRGPGYVELVPEATHDSLTAVIYQKVNREMRAHFRAFGFPEAAE